MSTYFMNNNYAYFVIDCAVDTSKLDGMLYNSLEELLAAAAQDCGMSIDEVAGSECYITEEDGTYYESSYCGALCGLEGDSLEDVLNTYEN